MRDALRNTLITFSCLLLVTACVAPTKRVAPFGQVMFVCEHGNVKSLMAASYFNEMASSRGLPYRAISRGSAPDSDVVPPAIITGLRTEGFDVSSFRPVAVDAVDLSASQHVVLINAVLPSHLHFVRGEPETWTDVPPASVDYAAAGTVLRNHVSRLLDDLARPSP